MQAGSCDSIGRRTNQSTEWLIELANTMQLLIARIECAPDEAEPDPLREWQLFTPSDLRWCHIQIVRGVLGAMLGKLLLRYGLADRRGADLAMFVAAGGEPADLLANFQAVIGTIEAHRLRPLGKREDSVIAAGLRHVHENYQRATLSLRETADVCGMSIWRFDRVFVRATRKHFRHYVRDLRLVDAHARVRMSTASVKQIAFEVGYGSESVFCRNFRAKFGTSASGVRRGSGPRRLSSRAFASK